MLFAVVKDNEPKRLDNIKKWLVALGWGVLSCSTCCCCFGGFCGRLRGPRVLYDEKEYEQGVGDTDPDNVASFNRFTWVGTGVVGGGMGVPSCCGAGLGMCGTFSPKDVADRMCACIISKARQRK